MDAIRKPVPSRPANMPDYEAERTRFNWDEARRAFETPRPACGLNNLLIALHERLGVDVPEADYRKADSLDGLVNYLAQRSERPSSA